MNRRGFLAAALATPAAIIAAPAIVRFDSLMRPVPVESLVVVNTSALTIALPPWPEVGDIIRISGHVGTFVVTATTDGWDQGKDLTAVNLLGNARLVKANHVSVIPFNRYPLRKLS